MWLFTNFGFFSIVQKPEDVPSHNLTIRSRTRSDLETLRDKYLPTVGSIQKNSGTDYRYRAKIAQTQFASALEKIALDIDYSNFKSSVAKQQGTDRSHLYEKVWTVLAAMQDIELKPAPSKKPGKTSLQHSKPHTDIDIFDSAKSFGGVVFSDTGSILLRKPTKEFDGYVWTFAKGVPERNESHEDTARREVLQETGYSVDIACKIPPPLGGFVGGQRSASSYYVMFALRDRIPFDPKETQEIKWVEAREAPDYINQTRNIPGRKRDLQVLEAAIKEFHRLGR